MFNEKLTQEPVVQTGSYWENIIRIDFYSFTNQTWVIPLSVNGMTFLNISQRNIDIALFFMDTLILKQKNNPYFVYKPAHSGKFHVPFGTIRTFPRETTL